MRDMKQYFENNQGYGILATADANGMVDAAIFARPHIIGDNIIAFIMPDNLTHKNLRGNPNAVYMFIENRPDESKPYCGTRLYLSKTAEEKDTELLNQLRRRKSGPGEGRFLVFFVVTRERPLVGDDPV